MSEEYEDEQPECWKCFGEADVFDDECPICHGTGFAPARDDPLPSPQVRKWLAEWASEMLNPAVDLKVREAYRPGSIGYPPPHALFSGYSATGSDSLHWKCTLDDDGLELSFTIPVTGEVGFFGRAVTRYADCTVRLSFKPKAEA